MKTLWYQGRGISALINVHVERNESSEKISFLSAEWKEFLWSEMLVGFSVSVFVIVCVNETQRNWKTNALSAICQEDKLKSTEQK